MGKPINFDDSNVVFTAPGCHDLPAKKGVCKETGRPYIMACIQLDEVEAANIRKNGRVWVRIEGEGWPPLLLQTDTQPPIAGEFG